MAPMTSPILDTLIKQCASTGTLTAYQQLAEDWLPLLLGLTGHYFAEKHLDSLQHREAVCRDTLLLAWRNRQEIPTEDTPSQWLYRIFGSVLYNRLLAIHGSEADLLQWLGSRYDTPLAMMESPTGPRPALFSGEELAALAESTLSTTPPEPPSQHLQRETEQLIQAEIDQLSAPLTPTGERVYPPLYHPELHARMSRSRAAFRFKEGFKRRLGRPLEDWLFKRWLDNKPGSAALERQGLLRRSVEAHLGDKLEVEIDPLTLKRGLSYPRSFPDRALRRRVSNLFLWPGDWDIPTPRLTETQRHRFIEDIWRHRLDLTGSDNYAELMKKLEQEQPLSLHHQGILLNSPERILGYLNQYRMYMEDMSCFGFKADVSKDQLGAVIDRDGGLIKSNKGLHRLAMAQVLGIQRIIVRVRAVHQRWWEHQTEGTKGKEAMHKLNHSISGLE